MCNPKDHIVGFFIIRTGARTTHLSLRQKDEEYVTGMLDLCFLDIDKDIPECIFDETLDRLLLLSLT